VALFGSDPSKPFRDEIDSFAAEFEALRSASENRLTRSKLYRDEIESTRHVDKVASPAQTADYGRGPRRSQNDYQRNKFRFPLGQALTVKHAYRIAGRMPDVVVDRRQETPEERYRSDTMEKVWWAVVYDSDGEVAFADAAWDSSQIGSSAFEVYPSKTGGPPCFRALDSAMCLPVLGVDDPHDFQRFYRWWRVPYGAFVETYQGASFRDVPVDINEVQFDTDERMVTIVECCSKQKRIRFTLGVSSGSRDKKHVALEEWTHGYGFVPNVIVPNLGPYRKVFGWADYEFVREIIRYIPQLFGREADIIQMVANGAMMMKGTKLSPAQVKRLLAEGGVIPVGRDGDLVPVQVPDVPQFAIDHHNRAFDLMERLGFAPPAAWGAAGSSSGSDRGLQLQPMVELTAMKQKNWSAGLSRLAAYTYQMIEKKMVGAQTFKGTYPTGNGQQAFNLILGEGLDDLSQVDETTGDSVGSYPRDPKKLFGGDYKVRFLFADRIDYDDPAYVASELNKFAQNVQSATTTLEHLGIESPEDEMKLIQQEAEAFPWLRPGMLQMMQMAQDGANQQGQNDGSQNATSPEDAMMGAMGTMGQPDGQALDSDAMAGALPGSSNGQLYGGA